MEGDGLAAGSLAQAAFASNGLEAEVIQGLLESAGIPSLLRPTGFNGPQMLGAVAGGAGAVHGGGSQRVMVNADRAQEARALLAESVVEDGEGDWSEIANAKHLEGGRGPRNYGYFGAIGRIYLWGFGVMAVAFGVFLLLRLL